MNSMKRYLGVSVFICFVACSQNSENGPSAQEAQPAQPAPPSEIQTDQGIVRGLAIIEVRASDSSLNDLETMDVPVPTSVTYINAPSVKFEIDPSNLVAGAMTGDTLSLGQVTVTDLKDNKLDLCGTSGNQKCTTAEIRVYTTGAVAGFVNTSEVPNYGMPVYASGLNAMTPVPLGKPGLAVQQVKNIPTNKHNLKLSDFPSPTYKVTSDFTNAGSGTYKMTFVVEYALLP